MNRDDHADILQACGIRYARFGAVEPVAVFEPHRMTLLAAGERADAGFLTLPVTVVTFDRHRDALPPVNGSDPLMRYRQGNATLAELARLVSDHVSVRNDDWILSGMELGLIGDAVQFSSTWTDRAPETPLVEYRDGSGVDHRLYHLGMPADELAFKGALADRDHTTVNRGLWDILGWDPKHPDRVEPCRDLVLDFDLDVFTVPWDTYAVPFTDSVFVGEFHQPVQTPSCGGLLPFTFMKALIDRASLVTIARESGHCGGGDHADLIMRCVERWLFVGGGETAL